jgi:glutathione S-transferase
MRHFGIAFDEIVIPMAQENTRAEMLRFSPAGKCPSLHDGNIVVWDSLATIEYVAERHPNMPIWPRPWAARAQARSLAAEMHLGFMAMRGLLPMNMRREVKQRELTSEEVPMSPVLNKLLGKPAGSLVKLAPSSSAIFRRPTRCSRRWSIVCMRIRWRSRPARGPIWTR